MGMLHRIARGLLACATWAACLAAHAQAPAATEAERVTTARLVYGLVSDARYAYRAQPFDDAMSSRVFDAYVHALERHGGTFDEAALQALGKYRQALDDAVKRGRLDPIYEIADRAGPRSRDESLAIFLNAYTRTVDQGTRYLSPFVDLPSAAGEKRARGAASVATRSTVDIGGKRVDAIAVGALYGFAQGSVLRDVAQLLAASAQGGADGIVLDLRGSPGGALVEVVALAGLFLGPSPVMQIRETGGRVSVERTDRAAVWTGPLAVLVDGETESGAEMLAAALRDSGRALVVGERTAGLGTIQNPVDLDRGAPNRGQPAEPRFGQVVLTIAETFRLDGRPIHGAGVEPDIRLPSDRDRAAPSARIAVSDPIRPARGHVASSPYDIAALVSRQQARAAGNEGSVDRLSGAAAVLVDAMAQRAAPAGASASTQ
ncbi:MAG TPA: S41 family peptidase [Lysobacter sp.]